MLTSHYSIHKSKKPTQPHRKLGKKSFQTKKKSLKLPYAGFLKMGKPTKNIWLTPSVCLTTSMLTEWCLNVALELRQMEKYLHAHILHFNMHHSIKSMHYERWIPLNAICILCIVSVGRRLRAFLTWDLISIAELQRPKSKERKGQV